MQELVPRGAFDLIKLDIEGEELHIFPDEPSRAVLCRARCLFLELHENIEIGCQAALDDFIADGCPPAQRFELVETSGEYMLYCQSALVRARSRPAR